jgi:mono/diheme cytochrome c family protein
LKTDSEKSRFFNRTAPIHDRLVGLAFNWLPNRILYVVDSPQHAIVALHLQDDGRVFRLQELRWATRATYAALVTLVIGASVGYGLVRSVTPALAALDQGYEAGSLYGRELASGSATVAGERLFLAVGCAKCHTPSLPVDNRQVSLYSDLLLYNMGPALDDKVVQGDATGSEWRTTPLWGLGLRTRFLHDGRARTLRDAIIAHDGEAQVVTRRFLALQPHEQEAVYRFLHSL